MNSFIDKLQYSMGASQDFDIAILKFIIPSCVDIQKSSLEQDKCGVDYIVTLKNGAQILVDAKAREKGAKKYWKYGEPELALEIYSVVEKKKVGWTLSTKSNVDYILYTFDQSDTDKFYFFPFQILRTAFWNNGRQWKEQFGEKIQYSDSWRSSAIFVPASVVIDAIVQIMASTQYFTETTNTK